MNKIFLKTIILSFAIFLIASCDKDFNNVGASIIDDDHYGMERYTAPITVISDRLSTGPIQSNNLDLNQLGIYANPVTTFGTTTANFATQVQLASVAPTIDSALFQDVQSVTLYIPYTISSQTATTTTGSYTYTITNSLNPTGFVSNKMKLSVYQNGVDLSTPTVNSVSPSSKLFTDSDYSFNLFKIGTRLNEDITNLTYIPSAHNDEFSFSNAEIVDNSTTTPVYYPPGIRINLNKDKFKNLIFNSSSGTNLLNNSNFTQYFRGLYFKTESIFGSTSCMNLIDFKKGTITIKYIEKTSVSAQTGVDKTIVLNLVGNTVSLLNNSIVTAPITDRIILKGGEGLAGKINLFGTPRADGKFQDLENLKYASDGKKRIINEANLIFYVDNNYMNGALEPDRIFLYDLRNKRPIIDYYYDSSTSTTFNNSKFIHGGIREDVTGITNVIHKYKIRLTNHIRNLVSKDSTNITLGVAVCYNILNPSFSKAKNAPLYNNNPLLGWQSLDPSIKNSYFFPTTSITNPLGTVIWGSENTVPLDKRLQLEIWYTKSD